MKIHDEIEDWLAAAVTDGFSPEERQNFEQHLAGCPRCRALHEEQKIMSNAIAGTFQNIKPDENFEQRVAQNFRRKLAQKSSFSLLAWLARFTQARTVQWALALLLTVALIKGGQVLTGEAPRDRFVLSGTNTYTGSKSVSAGNLQTESHDFFLGRSAFGSLELANASSAGGESAPREQDGADAPAPSAPVLESAYAATEKEPGRKTFGWLLDAKLKDAPSHALEMSEFAKPLAQAQRRDGLAPAKKSQSSSLAADKLFSESRMSKVAQADDRDEQAGAPQMQPPVSTQPAPSAPDRKLVRNAALEFEVKDFAAALESVRTITSEEQGYVATADSARGANGKLRGTIVVKMLPANLDRFLLKLRALGELKNQRIGSEDVTKSYFDTDARLRNAKVMEARLLEMLQKNTGKVSDLLQVEKELARVREQIEQMQGDLKFWDAQVAYATVTLTLSEKDLNQAAAFLLKERANLALFSPDVEKTYAAARTEANAAKAQVLQAKLERDSDGRVSATLFLLLAPEIADQTIARMKALGRVQTFNTQDERVTKEGSGGGEASDTAKIERDKVQFNLVISHDDESRRQTTMTLVTPQVEAGLDAAKTAALAQHAEVVSSNVAREPNGHGTGQLTVRVPAENYAATLEALKKIGRVAGLAIQRNDRAGEEEGGPVLISLTLTSDESPIQRTNLSVLSEKVEEKSAALKQAAERAGAEMKNSTFERQSGGVEVANLTILLPLPQSAAFVEQIKELGKVSNFTVQRNEANAVAGDSAPAQIDVRLFSRGDLVPAQNGVWATFRRTLAQGVAALLWSVRMIAVALAFVLPWAAGIALLAWLVARLRRGKK